MGGSGLVVQPLDRDLAGAKITSLSIGLNRLQVPALVVDTV